MSKNQIPDALRLPPFVTPEAVGDLLNWARSIKREFREAARVSPVSGWAPGVSDEDIYEDIVRLLAQPGGGQAFGLLMLAADGEKLRGLMKAIHKRVLGVLGPLKKKGDEASDLVLKLRECGDLDLAAWLTFDELSWSSHPSLANDALVDLVENDEELRVALGDYWTDWTNMPERVVGSVGSDETFEEPGEGEPWAAIDAKPVGEAPRSIVRVSMVYEGEEISDDGPMITTNPPVQLIDAEERSTWSAEVGELRVALGEASAFDPSLLLRLKLGLERLELLVAGSLERREREDTQLAALAEAHVGDLDRELEWFGEDAPWRVTIVDAAARLPANRSCIVLVGEATSWASSSRVRIEVAALRRQAALDRVQTDDSDEAGEELRAANFERRQTREEINGEAARWIAEFLAGASRADASDPEETDETPFEEDTELLRTVSANDADKPDGSSDSVVADAVLDDTERTDGTPFGECTEPLGAVSTKDTDTSGEASVSFVLNPGPEGSKEAIHPQSAVLAPAAMPASKPNDLGSLAQVSAYADQVESNEAGHEAPHAPQKSEVFSVPSAFAHLVERALEEGRYGFAAHLQLAVETIGAANPSPASSSVLEALCIGNSITAARLGSAEHRYDAVLPRVLADLGNSAGMADGVRLLAFAGAIKPALFSMQTSAAEAIRTAAIGGLGSRLHSLAEFVVDELPKRGGVIDLASLRPAGNEHEARDEVERVRTRLLEIADDAPAKKALFMRASIIWRDLFQKDGSVLHAVTALRRRAPNAALLVQEAGEELEEHLGKRCRDLDRAAKRNRDAWLEGKALEWLLTSVRELADSMHAYTAACERCSVTKTTHIAETAEILAVLVAEAAEDVARCLERPEMALAARVTDRVLSDVASLLAGRLDTCDPNLSVDALLDGDLLLVRPYPAQARRRSLTADGALSLLNGAQAVIGVEPDFESAFASLVAAGRFEEAIQAAERIAPFGPDRKKLDDEVADARLQRFVQVETRCTLLRTQLDDLLGADMEGLIDPASSVQLEGLIASFVGPEISSEDAALRLDFPALEAELARLETAALDGAELLLEPLKREMEGLEVPPQTAAILQELADRRELSTLRECMNGLRDGAELDLGGRHDNLLRTFSQRYLSARFAQASAQERNVVSLAEAAKQRRDTALVPYSVLAEEDVPAAVSLLEAWQNLKRAGPDQRGALHELLGELRFTNVKVTGSKRLQRAHHYSVVCDVTSDRRDCPVPAFGSASNGRLEVLLLEAVNVLDGVELHGLVKGLENASTVPTLVIVKGLVPPDRRLKFMCEARRRAGQETCALLDEAGILFLSAWPQRRRADTFAVALPGGGVQPYSDTSGKTSPEMFFGRSEELGQLWRADGPCLVYGGRQLGKTALLEQVRLRNHKAPGQIVVYGSFQGETDIWRKVAQLLKQGGLSVKGHSAGAVETAVREGLNGHDARRIVILIDEADTYLEKEMQDGYPTLARVRDLMQATERRCKFVFAGLHNVQRLARVPNSPLLHFGTPLRIGPLFGHDLGEAREMVVGPMAAAGIIFSNPALPNSILSAVGFYPSLLQTFGSTLINRVNKSAQGRLKIDSILPIVVDEHDIQNALEDHDFKENIRSKFRMTLSLDERYRLITLAMLQRSLDRRDQASIPLSLTDVEVQTLAREWWPQGFEDDSSLDAFQGLLQEMVGLGVLNEFSGRYAIRSSRIAAMLGGKEQIERELVELSESPGAAKLDTGSLRRLDRDTRAPSPLTSRQEGQLFSSTNASPNVHVALGSRALGMDRLASTLGELQDDDLVIRSAPYKTAREFGAQLASARDQVRSGRLNLVVLSGPWLGREMVDAALEAGSRRGARSGSLRIIIAPTWINWDAADEIDEHGRLWGADLLTLSTLGRSGLGQWLRAQSAPESPQMIDAIRCWTGGFPLFLEDFGRATDVMTLGKEIHERNVSSPSALADLGLEDERLLAAARIVAQYDPHDLAADLDSMGVGPGFKVVGHLARLGLLEAVQEAGETRWRINPFLAAVLSQQS